MSIIVYGFALGMECRVIRCGTQQFDMPRSGRLDMRPRGPSVLYLKQSLVAQPPCCPTDHLVYSDGLSPLLLSDKISIS